MGVVFLNRKPYLLFLLCQYYIYCTAQIFYFSKGTVILPPMDSIDYWTAKHSFYTIYLTAMLVIKSQNDFLYEYFFTGGCFKTE